MKNFIKQVNEFYPKYLMAHRNPYNKLLHVIGNLTLVATTGIVCNAAFKLLDIPAAMFVLALYLPIHLTYFIYLFAWPGHLLIEKNKPATWKTSRWITKACDWKMMLQLATRKLKFDTRPKLNLEFALDPQQRMKNIGYIEDNKNMLNMNQNLIDDRQKFHHFDVKKFLGEKK